MAYWVDGNNLMHELGAGGSPDGARVTVDRVREVAGRCGGRYQLVFDGPPSGGFASDTDLGDVKVRFSGKRAADDVILGFLRQQAQVRGVTVVTADRALASSCRALGATVVSGREFLRSAPSHGAPPRRPAGGKPTHVDVREWEEFFAAKRSSRPEGKPDDSTD